ncbi:MAG: hypothetical protein AAF597_07265, partial [Bacteroidota bacterium]
MESEAIFDDCNLSINPSTPGCYTFIRSSDGTGDFARCGAFVQTFSISIGGLEATAFAIQPSCESDGTINSDGYLQISSITGGTDVRANWTLGSNYDSGDPDYANAFDLSGATFPYIFPNAMDLANPSGTQDYTIRIFDGGGCAPGDCFTDITVTMNQQDCTVGCECTEVVYLNETANTGRVHKYNILPDGSFDEIFNDGGAWYPGSGVSELPSPHGLGTDLNGNVYIGENINPSNIRKLTCDGRILPVDSFALATNGTFNITSVGNTLFYNATFGTVDNIVSSDLCTGASIGGVTFCEGIDAYGDWGFHYNPVTERFYSSANRNDAFFGGGNPGYIWVYELSDFDDDPATCVTALPLSVPLDDGDRIEGVTSDNDGNIYLVVSDDGNGCSQILKYDAAGTFVTSSTPDCAANGEGYILAIGIVYSETSDMLYVSSLSFQDDCVTAFSTDLQTITEIIGPATSSGSKGIAITKECCPTNNNVVIDTVLCDFVAGDFVLLQELINCEGSICEGGWTADPSNDAGVMFDPCNNSVTISALDACGTFVLESDGTGPNARCGAFRIEVNISISTVIAPVIAGDQEVCSSDDATELTIATPAMGVDQATYQWLVSTESDSTGFVPVPGATMESYTPVTAELTADSTYFALEVTNTNSDCISGNCLDTSNVVLVELFTLPEIVLPPNPTICSTQPIDLVTGVSITPDTLGGSWVQSGNGTFLN